MGFQNHLLTEYNPQCKGPLSVTSCNKYLKKWKVVIHHALAIQDLSVNPFAGFKMPKEKTTMAFLTLDGDENLDIIRRIFIFACYSGLRYADCFSLLRRDVKIKDGHHWISVRQMKTQVLLQRPLFKPSVEVYKYFELKYSDLKTAVPYYTNQYVNRLLKRIAHLAGIHNKKISFHTSRHTHACILIEKGVDLLTTSMFMGHVSTRLN